MALLDRDGTLIEHIPYLSDPDQVRLLPGTAEGLKSLQDQGYWLVLVSNQSGVGRGYFESAQVEAVNAKMQQLLLAQGGVALDLLLFCPHAPEAKCACRKPSPGLAEQALQLLPSSGTGLVVGDSDCDMQLAERLGWPGFRIGQGHFASLRQVAEGLLNQA